jgi:ABC-type polysaccharide/polyol phosphate transport system ATPase subunit
MARIVADHISFHYPIYETSGRSLKMIAIRQIAGARLAQESGLTIVQALDDVSFELNEGDRLGLIGHNGSGKSTLLRVIAGLAYPQKGRFTVDGKVISLIEKSLGINPDLSGFENIELPLLLLGATSAEVNQAQRDIPEWTGLGPFIHMPFRTYSEGMKARLSFAICTALSGDILVLDEWLGAGDAAFVEQAEQRLREFVSRSKILVLASHSLELISHTCNVTAWLERGRIRQFGPTEEVVAAYTHHQAEAASA